VRSTRDHSDRPVLITEAPVNADDEFDHRRKRYLLMMIIRALCIVGAATTFHLSGWLAALFVVAAAVLPWAAVLLANDRPAKQELRFRRFAGADVAPPEPTPLPVLWSEPTAEQARRARTGPDDKPWIIDL
jgi:hypothetical protein